MEIQLIIFQYEESFMEYLQPNRLKTQEIFKVNFKIM